MKYSKFMSGYIGKYGKDLLDQLAEDELRCRCCYSKKNLEIHHILPRSEGGTDSYRNLIVLCKDCHNKVELEELTYTQYANGFFSPKMKDTRVKVKVYKNDGDNLTFIGYRYE